MQISLAFGKVIKKWRLARKLSQSELALACGLDRTFISLLERGGRQPSLTTVFSISKALKVAPEELVRQTSAASKNSAEKRRPTIISRRL